MSRLRKGITQLSISVMLLSLFLQMFASSANAQGITQVTGNEIVSNGYYVFAIPGINSYLQGRGQYALSSNPNTNTSPLLRSHIKFDETLPQVNEAIVWQAIPFGSGYSLKAYSEDGTNAYLNISEVDLTLGEQQELVLTVNDNGTILISREVNGTYYYVRFTNANGVGWQSSPDNSYLPSMSFRVFPVTENMIISNDRILEINAHEIVSGGFYSLSIPGINSNTLGRDEYALASESNGNAAPLLLRHIPFDVGLKSISAVLVWQIESYGSGYSLKAYSKSGGASYLNLNGNDLTLGERQELSLIINDDGTVQISRNANGSIYYVRFTNLNGVGWQSSTDASYKPSMSFRVSAVPLSLLENNPIKPVSSSNMHSGGYYIFAHPGIGSTDQGHGQFALSGIENINSNNSMLRHVKYSESQYGLDDTIVWKYEAYGSGFSLKLLGADGTDSYLNLDMNGSTASATLGPRQELKFTRNADGTAKISRSLNGTTYYVRFTTAGGVGWQAGTYDSSNAFNQPSISLGPKQTLTVNADATGLASVSRVIDGKTYYVRFTTVNGQGWQASATNSNNLFHVYEVNIDKTKLDLEEPREQPLFTISALSDLHVDYGLQDNPDVIRPQIRAALGTIKTNENPDLVVVTGDSSSTTGSIPWGQETYNKFVSQVTGAFAETSKYGKVLYVNGNHDYEAGSTAYNSGAYIDSTMLSSLGQYEDVLYEGVDRTSNLLAYHYMINGIHFIGINTPYNGDETIDSNVYTPEAIDFVENTLLTIGNTERVIVLGHYPLQGSKALTAPAKALSDENGMNTRLHRIFLNYPNLIYLYGHDHGGPFIEQDTFERVTAYNADGSIEQDRNVRSTGYVSSFAGSLSYYNNRYNPGPLSAEQPAVIQSLMVYVYEDYVDLQMKNYGERNGIKKNLAPYTIPFREWITSRTYTIDHTAGTVTDIPHQTTIEAFLAGFDQSEELSVFGLDGNEITDHSRIIRSGMELKRMSGTAVLDSLQVLVNQAAVTTLPIEGNSKVPSSAETEMVALTDQQFNKIVVYKQDSPDWNDPNAIVWKWQPTTALGFTGISTFDLVTDAKLRYSEFYGGYVVVTTASRGFVGIIDYETGERLYSRATKNEENPHSIELLPDGNIVVADSVGNAVTIYASSQGDANGYYYRVELPGAHGLVWDNQRKLLWAVGDYEVVAYEITGTTERPTLTLKEGLGADLPAMEGKEGAWGHDLFPVTEGGDLLWVTAQYEVYQFNMVTGELSNTFDSHDDIFSTHVKSIGTQPYTGNIIRTVPNGTMASWATNAVDIFRFDGQGSYTHDLRIHNSEAYYKARTWYPSIRMINDMIKEEPSSPLATDKPGKPVLSSDSGYDTGLRDGNYTITMNQWWGNNGTTYKLYENGGLIDTQSLIDKSPDAQTAATVLTGRINGTYVYTCELINSYGTTNCDSITVVVADALPGNAVLSSDNWDGDGSYNVMMNMWWGTNAATFELYENGELVQSVPLLEATPGAQFATVTMTDKLAGTYEYYGKLINAAGETITEKIVVHVS